MTEAQKDPLAEAREMYDLGYYEDALDALSRLEDANGGSAEATLISAKSKIKLDQAEDAILDLHEFIKQRPGDADGFLWRAYAHRWLGQHVEGITDATKAIELRPDQAAYLMRGTIYMESQAHGNAIEDLTKAIALDDSQWEPYLRRGQAYTNQGNRELALADINKAIELDDGNAYTHETKARFHEAFEEWEEANAEAKQAIRLDPEYINPYLTLARTYNELDDPETAEMVCRDGLDRAPFYDELLEFWEAIRVSPELFKDEEFVNAVYYEREQFYETTFGALPKEIMTLRNLTGVWPGGCLMEIEATELDESNLWVTISSGLTNPDMPTSVTAGEAKFEQEQEPDGTIVETTTLNLAAREPAHVPPWLAGYGYEVCVLTRGQQKWALSFLNWCVPAEILHDIEILDAVKRYGGASTNVDLDGVERFFLFTHALEPISPKIHLPNGMAHILVAIAITEKELEFAREKGYRALREKLIEAEVGMISDFNRNSVV